MYWGGVACQSEGVESIPVFIYIQRGWIMFVPAVRTSIDTHSRPSAPDRQTESRLSWGGQPFLLQDKTAPQWPHSITPKSFYFARQTRLGESIFTAIFKHTFLLSPLYHVFRREALKLQELSVVFHTICSPQCQVASQIKKKNVKKNYIHKLQRNNMFKIYKANMT